MYRSVWVGFRYRRFLSLLTSTSRKGSWFSLSMVNWIVRSDVGGTSLVQYCRVARWQKCRPHIWSMCSVSWWWCSALLTVSPCSPVANLVSSALAHVLSVLSQPTCLVMLFHGYSVVFIFSPCFLFPQLDIQSLLKRSVLYLCSLTEKGLRLEEKRVLPITASWAPRALGRNTGYSTRRWDSYRTKLHQQWRA